MKRTIHIDRPDGNIPGLLEVNAILAERFGCVIVVTVNMDNKERYEWVSCSLRKAHIENDGIVVEQVITPAPTKGQQSESFS